jgi:LysR family transcriptional activator of nhaA
MVAQFEDTALMNAFGEAGAGVFALPSAIEEDVLRRYRVAVVGRTREVTERFYLISPERRLKHPSVVAIMTAARSQLFG